MQGVANKRMLNIDNICEHTFIGDYLSNDSIVVDLGINHGGFSKTISNYSVKKVEKST